MELHELLGLKQSQIYKWNWDMHKKGLAERVANGAKTGLELTPGQEPISLDFNSNSSGHLLEPSNCSNLDVEMTPEQDENLPGPSETLKLPMAGSCQL